MVSEQSFSLLWVPIVLPPNSRHRNPNLSTMATITTPTEEIELTEPTNKSKDLALTLTSPYYLHPAENPGAVLVTPPMNDNSYDTWSKKMKRALLTKNKIKFINGKITAPNENDELYEAWERCNGTMVAWIAGSLTPEIAQIIENVESAFDLWNELKNRSPRAMHFGCLKNKERGASVHTTRN